MVQSPVWLTSYYHSSPNAVNTPLRVALIFTLMRVEAYLRKHGYLETSVNMHSEDIFANVNIAFGRHTMREHVRVYWAVKVICSYALCLAWNLVQ